jgi:hypothetical protein
MLFNRVGSGDRVEIRPYRATRHSRGQHECSYGTENTDKNLPMGSFVVHYFASLAST